MYIQKFVAVIHGKLEPQGEPVNLIFRKIKKNVSLGFIQYGFECQVEFQGRGLI